VVLVTGVGNEDANAIYNGSRVLDEITFGKSFVEAATKLAAVGVAVQVWGYEGSFSGMYKSAQQAGAGFLICTLKK
jgi:hypothetical protein